MVKLRRRCAHLLNEQKVLESLGSVGLLAEYLWNIWLLDEDRALCRFGYVAESPLDLDVLFRHAWDLGGQIGTLHQGLAPLTREIPFPTGNLPATIVRSVVPVLAQTGRPLLMSLAKRLLANEDALWESTRVAAPSHSS